MEMRQPGQTRQRLGPYRLVAVEIDENHFEGLVRQIVERADLLRFAGRMISMHPPASSMRCAARRSGSSAPAAT